VTDSTPNGETPTATTTQPGETPTGQTTTAPSTWEAALAVLPEPVRALYEAHTTGLRNAVQATRQERDALSGRLTELTKALGKDTPEEAKRLLAEMAGELEATNRRAAFYEEAGRPEIGCANARVAFQVAQAEGLFDKRGSVNWAALKAAAPELFRVRVPAGNAGQGTGQTVPTSRDMNAFIRAASGRR
jgi:autotransporter adhesin